MPWILTDDLQALRRAVTRRAFLGRAAAGLGSLALPSARSTRGGLGAATERGRRGAAWSIRCTFPPRAKRVIYLYMAGGPSHLETFDYKPKLAEMHGQPMPESFTKGQPIAQLQGRSSSASARSIPFQRYGQSGPGDLDAVPAHRRRSPTTSASSAR